LIPKKDNCLIKPGQLYSCGIHPWFIDSFEKKWEELVSMVRNKQIIAIGECGMDLRKKYTQQYNPQWQQTVFEKHIYLSQKTNKPLIIHCVKCQNQLIELRKKYPEGTWIYHGFDKKKESARQLTKAGIYLSFGPGIITHPSTAEALQHTSLDKIFLETDEQKDFTIEKIYQQAAKLLNITIEELSIQLQKNFEKAFHIKLQN
jgi:TatD DNase family protein